MQSTCEIRVIAQFWHIAMPVEELSKPSATDILWRLLVSRQRLTDRLVCLLKGVNLAHHCYQGANDETKE